MKRKSSLVRKNAKRQQVKKQIKRLATMPNIDAENVINRMREKDLQIPCNKFNEIQKKKKEAQVYYLLTGLLQWFECDEGDVQDEVLFFKTIYFLDQVLVKAKTLAVKKMEEYCVVSFIIQWKLERIQVNPGFDEAAEFLESYRQKRCSELKHSLLLMELEVLHLMNYNLYTITPFDFVKTFMCTQGCIYTYECEYLFEKKASDTLKRIIKSSEYNLRRFKAETIAYLIIYLVRGREFGPAKQYYTATHDVSIETVLQDIKVN